MPSRAGAIRPIARRLLHSQPRPETLTLLRKTVTLLPRVLPPASSVDRATDSFEFWNDLLARQPTQKPARIAVYGLDEYSGAKDLVTALLEDPLASDQSHNEQLRNRWKDRTDRTLLISRDVPAALGHPVFHTSLPYLRQHDCPLEIMEILPSGGNSTPAFDSTTSNLLLNADVPIIIANPLSTSVSALLGNPLLRDNPDAILILNSSPSPELTQSLGNLLSTQGSSSRPLHAPRILFLDPSRAVAANITLQSDPRSLTTVQRYQDEFVGSRISTLAATLKGRFSLPPGTSLPDQTSLAQIRATLSVLKRTLEQAQDEVRGLSLRTHRLNNHLERFKREAHEVVFNEPSNQDSKPADMNLVNHALQQAKKDVEPVMHRLTWWRMLWNIDETSNIVHSAVHQAWCRDLEKQLIMQTGRLVALQGGTTRLINKILTAQRKPPFDSPVLRNSLEQLTSSPSHKITHQTLTQPLDTRRAQITNQLTTQLHMAGQRTALGMSTGVATGAGVGWAGWVGWLAGSGEGLFDFVGLEPTTAVGVGLLTAVASVRWAAGKWERAKQRWWEDWGRVGDGLGRDLRATLDRTMEEKVLTAAAIGCSRLSEMADERKREIEELEEQLDALTQSLDKISPPSV